MIASESLDQEVPDKVNHLGVVLERSGGSLQVQYRLSGLSDSGIIDVPTVREWLCAGIVLAK